MKSIILAAGRGSRMGEVTLKLPKCRTLFRGKELLQWQLDALYGAGIKDIAIVRGYLGETFTLDVTYFENESWKNTNMVMSLMAASPWLERYECIVSYSDIVYSTDAVKQLMNAPGDIAITYDPNWLDIWSLRFDDPLSDAETFKIAAGHVIEIGGKASSVAEIEGQYMGLLRFSPVGWKKVKNYILSCAPDYRSRLDMTGLLHDLVKQGIKITATPIRDEWFEIDSVQDLLTYENL